MTFINRSSENRKSLWLCHDNHEKVYEQDPNKATHVLPWKDGDLGGWNGAATVQSNALGLCFDSEIAVSFDDGPLQLQDALTILRDMMIVAIKNTKNLPNERYEYSEAAVLALQNAIELFVQASLDQESKGSAASIQYVPDHRKDDAIEDIENITWRELRCSQNVSHIYPWDESKKGRLVQFKDGSMKFWDDYVSVEKDRVTIKFSGKNLGGMYTDDALAILREMAKRLLNQNFSVYLMCAIKNVQMAIELADKKAWNKHQFSWSKRESAYKPPYTAIFSAV